LQPVPVFLTRTTDACAVAKEGVAVAATLYSSPWSVGGGSGFSLHAEWTGTAAGNLQLWFSDKPNPVLTSDADWNQDTTFGTSGNVALGGAAGKYGDNVGNARARWWRFKLASGASSGTLFSWVTLQPRA